MHVYHLLYLYDTMHIVIITQWNIHIIYYFYQNKFSFSQNVSLWPCDYFFPTTQNEMLDWMSVLLWQWMKIYSARTKSTLHVLSRKSIWLMHHNPSVLNAISHLFANRHSWDFFFSTPVHFIHTCVKSNSKCEIWKKESYRFDGT